MSLPQCGSSPESAEEFTERDRRHMTRALSLARRGLYSSAPNPRVGCVLVRDGQVVGEGYHRRTGEAHAEAAALAAAGCGARGATAYVTLEPCRHTGRTPPCTRALIDAGIARVVAAMTDPNPRMGGQGLAELAAAGIETACGLLRDQALALNEGFALRMAEGRPFVRAKIAMSLDGRTAMASGESQWITGPQARRDVQHWRAASGAIITGVGTVLADDPRLTVRRGELDLESEAREAPVAQPLRVIMDTSYRTPPDARILDGGAPILVAGGATGGEHLDRRAQRLAIPGPRPTPAAVLAELGRREINDVLLEAGSVLCGAFTAAGLVDELLVYLAPILLGSDARPMMDLPGMTRMSDQHRFALLEACPLGADLRLRLRPVVDPAATSTEEG